MLDQGLSTSHPLTGHGQGQRHGREEPFGDVPHNDTDREDRADPEAHPGRFTNEEKDNPHEERQDHDDPCNGHDLFLKRTQRWFNPSRHGSNLAKFRFHSRRKDDRPAAPGEHGGAGKDQIGSF